VRKQPAAAAAASWAFAAEAYLRVCLYAYVTFGMCAYRLDRGWRLEEGRTR
jgi:hypothetical protein